MSTETHRQLASDIWSICNLLAPTKAQALSTFNEFKSKPESITRSKMQAATSYPFFNLSRLERRPSSPAPE